MGLDSITFLKNQRGFKAEIVKKIIIINKTLQENHIHAEIEIDEASSYIDYFLSHIDSVHSR